MSKISKAEIGLILLGTAILALALRIFIATPVRDRSPSETLPPVPTTRHPENTIDFKLLAEAVPDENSNPIFPGALTLLDGKQVSIQGFMAPFDDLEDLTRFMLFSFPTGCNFCAPPSADQVVMVRRPEDGAPYDYVDGPIRVTGTLSLWKESSDDPAHSMDFFLYLLKEVEVEPIDFSELTIELPDHGMMIP